MLLSGKEQYGFLCMRPHRTGIVVSMRKRMRMNAVSRFFITLLSVVMTAAMFLYWPSPQNPAPQNGYSYYHSRPSNPDSLAADELEPDRYSADLPAVEQSVVYLTAEAEDQFYPKGVELRRKRKGYSGGGYLSKLPAHTESAIEIPITAPSTQHYALTICVGANESVTNAIRVNGNLISPFSLNAAEGFVRVTFYGIFLSAGNNTVAIDTIDGGLDFDYIELRNDMTVYSMNMDIDKEPCNPNASANTRRLYHVLYSQWGWRIMTGQYASDGRNRELELLYQKTGQLPAIRFNALGTTDDNAQIEAAIDWSVYMNGAVGMMWQWKAPGTDSVYAKDTQFNLSEALKRVKPESLAMLSQEDAARAAENGIISQEAYAMLTDIDSIAVSLRKLANMDIPVIWRPLHEAGGGWYWWGASGKDAYEKLWLLLYHRLTDYHGLNNLIWVWNGQSARFTVPQDTYDIASADVYLQPDMEYGSRYEQFLSLANITGGKKMLALSECSSLPSQEMMKLDHSVWSFFGLWYGDYLMKADGSFNNLYYSSSDLYNLYNSELSISLNDFQSLYS